MKVSTKKITPDFATIVIEITIESEKEYNDLDDFVGLDHSVPKIAGENMASYSFVKDFLTKIRHSLPYGEAGG